MTKQNLINKMNVQLANWNVLNTKLHHYHWFVKGPDFFVLHEKFEEIYNEVAGTIDELAERILTIGGKPISTLREYLDNTTLEEAKGEETAVDMVELLAKDFEQLSNELSEVIEAAENENDHPTADLFIGLKGSLEKQSWMLQAYLDKSLVKAH
ncbi:DNA starvation/stationary phase protection protein [Evansella sp. AB-P1]|uniref:Dps family protein n=1 Tax=Evansella sp. AB-P1 TaxID=3037653 RepID=UPI00241D138F|nr:DNA starvation/stationary phase protection protein [Evansella sp. AB-P1]MDG5788001.1 DNA starvation/stationary phase protection protein [Evansella sp. AB-P1]